MARRKHTTQPDTDTRVPPINLPFTVESLRLLLTLGAAHDSPYTHQQIADWANRFWATYMEQYDAHVYEVGDNPRLDRAEEIAQAIDAQWDMYVSPGTSPLATLPNDLTTVRLPQAWFEQWQRQLDHPLPEYSAEA